MVGQNFFAVREPDPTRREALRVRLSSAEGGWIVREVARDWLIASAHDQPQDAAFADAVRLGEEDLAVLERVGLVALAAQRDLTGLVIDEDGGLCGVRSADGRVPLYYRMDPTPAIATRLEYFVRFLLETPSFDELALAMNVGFQLAFPERRTILAGVRCVPRGTALRMRGSASYLSRYWEPWHQPGVGRLGTTEVAAELRELLPAVRLA
jgi:hypothetical protein